MIDEATTPLEAPDPIAAATHPDPYPYYARLVAERPFHRDPVLGLWVASSAAAVTAVLTNPACRVRPRAEPIPPALLGTPAAGSSPSAWARTPALAAGWSHRSRAPQWRASSAMESIRTASRHTRATALRPTPGSRCSVGGARRTRPLRSELEREGTTRSNEHTTFP